MESIRKEDECEVSQISNWYAGKNVFITGATGFMGKVLVEKLLRSCGNINKMYILIRSKKGVDATARKEQYFKCVIFDNLFKKNPDAMKKVKIIKGDVLESGLGLSSTDFEELTENVNVIFHCAANVRFDQPLRPMVEMNVAGTQKVLKLAENMHALNVLVYVSTSYCQCNENVLEERHYPAPHNPFEIMEMMKTMDDDALAQITPKLLNGLPNTYAYSKALSEDLIFRTAKNLPIIITRPSIVTAAVDEPLPGWIEGINGPTGLMIGAARGVIRSMHCNPEYASTVIPVDKAINGMIIAACDRATSNSNKVEFCNLCISHKTLLSWGESIEKGKKFFYDVPLSAALWYPDGSIKKNYYYHLLCVFIFHYIPAYIIDFFLMLSGKKPFLVHIQRKISTGLQLLQYYTTKDWDFRNEKFQKISGNLNRIDSEEFDTSVNGVNWEKYIRNYIWGMRTYILGENPSTLPKAKRMLKRLFILDRLTKIIFYTCIFMFLWNHLEQFVDSGDAFIKTSLKNIYMSNNSSLYNHI